MVVTNIKIKTASRNCWGSNLPEKAPNTGMCLNPDDCAEKMVILSDPNRLRIIRSLISESHYVGEIAQLVNLSVHRVSHHLGIMRMVGLVESKRQGRNIIYNISRRILTKDGIDLGCCVIKFRGV